jgi:hypothetical protein
LKILLDESVPVQVRHALPGHDVSTVSGLGWKGMENGALLAAIEQTDFEVFVIADKNLRYQQNLTSRRVAIVELWTNHRPSLEREFPRLAQAILSATAGSYVVVPAP